MKSKELIMAQTEAYKCQLNHAVAEKERLAGEGPGELDLLILSLVDKLEILFWVLDIELPSGDLMDRYHIVYH